MRGSAGIGRGRMSLAERVRARTPLRRWVGLGAAAMVWFALYAVNGRFWTWLVGDLVGLDLGSIGLISLASFFYLLKFAWAPLIDRYAFPLTAFMRRRRSWLIVSQLLVGASLAALALMRPELGVGGLVAWVLVGSFAGATQDSVVDAYRIEIAPLSAQAALAATYTLGYRLGLIVGGAGALYIADFDGWRDAYLWMAALMLLPIATTVFCREPLAPESTVVPLNHTPCPLPDHP